MKILIDESLPRYLKKMMADHEAVTVQEAGWAGLKNGELLSRAESSYRVFLTADKNLRYQQNIEGRQLGLIVFPTNKLSVIKKLSDQLKTALAEVRDGQCVELTLPDT